LATRWCDTSGALSPLNVADGLGQAQSMPVSF
jgi:hypothetical protein